VPAHEWELDPAGFDDVWALRESGRLPERAVWFCSPEPKGVATAQLLTEGEVGVVDALREHVRESTDWIEDFTGTVARAFAEPDVPAYDGWEPLAACRHRVVRAVRGILDVHRGEDVVLVFESDTNDWLGHHHGGEFRARCLGGCSADDLAKAMRPRWMVVTTDWKGRGGIRSRIRVTTGAPPPQERP